MHLTCPKCHGPMRQYERSGVIIDQCDQCRGVFLDRGELEKLVNAETAYYGAAPGYGPAPGYAEHAPHQPAGYHEAYPHESYPPHAYGPYQGHGHYRAKGHGHHHRRHHGHYKRKHHGFLGELFD